jgi:hypothetical protein
LLLHACYAACIVAGVGEGAFGGAGDVGGFVGELRAFTEFTGNAYV